MNSNETVPTLFQSVDNYVHVPLKEYLVDLALRGYLPIEHLKDLVEFLLDHELGYLLDVLVSDPHACHHWDLPSDCNGEDMPTLADVIGHLNLQTEDLNGCDIKCYLEQLEISDILALQVMMGDNTTQ